jgi:uncharacterized small protein (DUF1192 family)
VRPVALSRLILGLVIVCAEGGCAQRAVSSAAPPPAPIVSYPNTPDRVGTTVFSADPYTAVAGVNGRLLTITAFEHQQPVSNALTLDANGNLGIRGSLSSVSLRSAKYDIEPYRGDALSLLRGVHLVTYRYRGETDQDLRHIGFIAEDAPTALSGVRHDEMNLNNSIAVEMAATKEMDQRIARMQAQIDALEQEVATLRAASSARTASR